MDIKIKIKSPDGLAIVGGVEGLRAVLPISGAMLDEFADFSTSEDPGLVTVDRAVQNVGLVLGALITAVMALEAQLNADRRDAQA